MPGGEAEPLEAVIVSRIVVLIPFAIGIKSAGEPVWRGEASDVANVAVRTTVLGTGSGGG